MKYALGNPLCWALHRCLGKQVNELKSFLCELTTFFFVVALGCQATILNAFFYQKILWVLCTTYPRVKNSFLKLRKMSRLKIKINT